MAKKKTIVSVVGVFAGVLALSGCVTNIDAAGLSTASTAAAAEKVDEIAATVPKNILSSGKLVVGVNIPYAPNEFKDSSGKIVGFDVDLMNAVASTLGLTADYREADFENIIPSIRGGTYNVGMSSFTDTKEREKVVDFVTYFSAGALWARRAGTAIGPNDACGHKVGVQSTTIEDAQEIPAKSDACVRAGKPPIEKVKFDRQDVATNALLLGMVDAMAADYPVTLWAIKQTRGKLEAAGGYSKTAPYGWPVVKGSPLTQSLLQALQHLIKTGRYQAIADHWGLESGMIAAPVINGAVN